MFKQIVINLFLHNKVNRFIIQKHLYSLIAQMDRAPCYELGGWEFKPL